ncbi:MAG TPA: hypothetical protein VMX97_12120 [Hyphomicrobiaceae bacterium]|nr:hypothetical protein [Hyphomicrobiaceae bacterium]
MCALTGRWCAGAGADALENRRYSRIGGAMGPRDKREDDTLGEAGWAL